MAECDYCGAAFDDEDALLSHMRDSHKGELGAIDRRRVANLEAGSSGRGRLMLTVGALAVLAAVAYFAFFSGGDPGTGPAEGPPESRALSSSGDAALLADVQSFSGASRDHVAAGTDVNYDHLPPTGGPHADDWAAAGFYEEPVRYERLVHNLEHGNVVVYYDPAAITPEAEESLRAFADRFPDTFIGVVVVPNPESPPESDYVLTAWGKRLRMDGYDAEVVHAFLSEYLGRGPENPQR